MTINVSKSTKGGVMPVHLTHVGNVPEEYALRDSQVLINIDGHLKNIEGVLMLNASLTAKLGFTCCKCLSDCEYLLNVKINEGFSKDPDAEQKELWPINDDSIDIEPAVMTNLFLNIPMKMLCKEDCKGLCHICGHDLNIGDCGCDKMHIDPRFEALRELFAPGKGDLENKE